MRSGQPRPGPSDMPIMSASGSRVLREDNRAIVRVASQASKAADYLLSFLPSKNEASGARS